MANRWGNSRNSDTLFWGVPKSLQTVTAAMKLKETPWKKSYDQPRQHIKKQSHYFANKGPPSQSSGFSSSHLWMWELDCKESWVLKNWCFLTVVLGEDSFFLSFIFISWRLITSQHCSGFCHTLTWISHGVTCVPHPNSPSHLPLHPIPLGLPSAPGPSTCLMHPTWAGDMFHYR